jgi:hypothetical protein
MAIAIGRRRGFTLADIGMGLFTVAGLSIIPGIIAFATWHKAHTEKAQWTVAGPACPTVAQMPAGFNDTKRPPKSFVYGDGQFTHAWGMAYCTEQPVNALLPLGTYRVCQFNNPGAVTVKAGGKAVTFQPPPGGRATVTVRKGEVSCVVGGWFSL